MSASSIPTPPAEPPRRPPGSAWRRLSELPRPALFAGAAVLGLGGVYAGALSVGGDTIAEGTTVHGVEIGGLTGAAARERLSQELAGELAAPVAVTVGPASAAPATYRLDPAEAGLSLDVEATVDQAERPGWLGRLFGEEGGALEPVVDVDDERARGELAELAERSGTELTEGAIAFEDGRVRVTEASSGSALDIGGSVTALRTAYLEDSAGAEPVELPVTAARPVTDAEDVARALAGFAEPAMSAPVVLTAAGGRIEISPEVLGDHLTMVPGAGGALRPELDGEGLAADPAVAGAVAAASVEPVNATLGASGDQVVVEAEAVPGSEVVGERLGDAVLPLLTESGDGRTGAAPVREVEPELTREKLPELGISEVMSSYTVTFDSAPYRVTNIGRAAELIDGSLVHPGQTWSFNDTVGERTEENGFVEGIIILDDRYQKASGGGVSAVATTMFNAVFFAGVKPVEYGAHSFYIERYPEGREATVAWGLLDNRFENDTDDSLYIAADATDTSVTITFLGTRKYDEVLSETGARRNVVEPATKELSGDSCVAQPSLEGFDITVDRVFRRGGEEVGRESFDTHYTPRDEVVCVTESAQEPPADPETTTDHLLDGESAGGVADGRD